ncbi:hypothetical protein BJY00DRAFT_303342 [Aspergillus carlsbadensis]|nr:hypothetical protein BJY00DRAFT_303342 [Aspergillus carlsbadensis]
MQKVVCDHCYAGKKKCTKPPSSRTCTRCDKLSLSCTNLRKQRRGGRPPKQTLPGVTKESLSIWDYQQVGDDDFYSSHDIYMIGSTFAGDFHRALEYCQQHSAHLLDDIFRACHSCLSWARFGMLPSDQVDMQSGASSVQKLRDASIANTHDAAAVLLLGQALAAFDSLVSCSRTISILRFSLSLTRPWYPEIMRTQLLQPIAIAPIFWDTIWCLLYREVPVIEPVFLQTDVVDRIVGVCTPLLPIFYDLCVASNNVLDDPNPGAAFDEIEHRVRMWSPTSPDPSQYTPLEILSMQTQAEMYRTATLLLIHRLRVPISPRPDDTAKALATSILDTRTRFFECAGSDAKLQNASFPLLLALLETETPTEGLWENSTYLRNRPACVDRLFGFVETSLDRSSTTSPTTAITVLRWFAVSDQGKQG